MQELGLVRLNCPPLRMSACAGWISPGRVPAGGGLHGNMGGMKPFQALFAPTEAR